MAVPFLSGTAAIATGTRATPVSFPAHDRFAMLFIGNFGLLVWAGLILRPVLPLAGGISSLEAG